MGNNIADLRKDIDELRIELNELSAVLLSDKVRNDLEVLNISKKLDTLIVKYLLLVKTHNID